MVTLDPRQLDRELKTANAMDAVADKALAELSDAESVIGALDANAKGVTGLVLLLDSAHKKRAHVVATLLAVKALSGGETPPWERGRTKTVAAVEGEFIDGLLVEPAK